MKKLTKTMLRALNDSLLLERRVLPNGQAVLSAAWYDVSPAEAPAVVTGRRPEDAPRWYGHNRFPDARRLELEQAGLIVPVFRDDVFGLTTTGAAVAAHLFGAPKVTLLVRPVPDRLAGAAATVLAACTPPQPRPQSAPERPRPWMATGAEECLEVINILGATSAEFVAAVKARFDHHFHAADFGVVPEGSREDVHFRLFGRVEPLVRDVLGQLDSFAATKAVKRLKAVLEAEGEDGLMEALWAIADRKRHAEGGPRTYALLFELATGWTPKGQRIQAHRPAQRVSYRPREPRLPSVPVAR